MCTGDLPEVLSQQILVGMVLVRRWGVRGPLPCDPAAETLSGLSWRSEK